MTYSVFGTNVPRNPYPTPRTGRVPGLPYRVKRVPGLPYRSSVGDASGLGNMGGSAPVLGAVVAVALLGGLGYLMYRRSQEEASVRAKLVEKEGAAGLAKYEEAQLRRRAGERGLDLLSSWLSPGMRRNLSNKQISRMLQEED